MKYTQYFPPVLLIVVVLAFDYAVYGSFHVPKYYAFLILTGFGYLIYASIHVIKKTSPPLQISLTLIEIIVGIRLLWLSATNPSMIITESDLSFLLIAGLFLCAVLVRQININMNNSLLIFLRSIWILALLQAVAGIVQWLTVVDFDPALYKTPLIGTIGPPNGYGIFLAAGIIAGITDTLLAYKRGRKRTAYLTCVPVLVLLAALYLNASRGATMGLITAACIVGVARLIIGRKIVFAAMVSIALISSGAVFYSLNPVSSEGRVMIWTISLPMFTDHFITGVGHGNFGYHYLDYQALYFSDPQNADHASRAAPLHQPHNEYLNAFIEGGVVNGLLFLSLWIIAFYRTFKSALRQKDIRHSFILYGMSGILIAVLVHAMVDDPFHVLPVAVMMYCLLGFVPGKNMITLHARTTGIKLFLLLVCVSAPAALLYKTVTEYPGYRHWLTGQHYAGVYQWQNALSSYEKAYRVLSGKHELQFHYGAAYVMGDKYAQGIDMMKKAVTGFADRNLYLSLSYALMNTNEIDEAIYYAEKVRAAFPDHLSPHLLLGELYYIKGDYERSRSSLLKCIHRETRVQSRDVEQIAHEARLLWDRYYGDL